MQVYNKTIIRQIKNTIVYLRNAYSIVNETINTLKSYKNTVSAIRFMTRDVKEFTSEVNEFNSACTRLIHLLEVLNDAQVEISDDEMLKIVTTNCSSFIYRTVEFANFPEETENVFGSKRITENVFGGKRITAHIFTLHGGI